MTIQNFKNNNALLPLVLGIKYQYDISSSVSSADTPTGGATQHYICFITAVCMTLMVSMSALADDTTTETCADGAGTVIEGAVADANGNKHKYCMSNNIMNWWNAVSWCDAQGRRLFSMDDCAFSSTSGTSGCPELKGIGGNQWIWTATPNGSSLAYIVTLSSGYFHGNRTRNGYDIGINYYALCY